MLGEWHPAGCGLQGAMKERLAAMLKCCMHTCSSVLSDVLPWSMGKDLRPSSSTRRLLWLTSATKCKSTTSSRAGGAVLPSCAAAYATEESDENRTSSCSCCAAAMAIKQTKRLRAAILSSCMHHTSGHSVGH